MALRFKTTVLVFNIYINLDGKFCQIGEENLTGSTKVYFEHESVSKAVEALLL